jgi:plastocyanin
MPATRRLIVRVLYGGHADPPRLFHPVEPACSSLGSSVGEPGLERAPGGAVVGAAVWLVPAGGASAFGAGPGRAEPVTVRLDGCRFVPERLIVAPGTVVRFINEDETIHSLTSESVANPVIDAGLPFVGMSTDTTWTNAELGVRVFDRRLPWMSASLAVVSAAAAGITDAAGVWSFDDPPVGPLSVQAWHADLGAVRVDLDMPAEGDLSIDLAFADSAARDEAERRAKTAR